MTENHPDAPLSALLCPVRHLTQHVRVESQKSRPANFGHRQLRGYWRVSWSVSLTHSLTLAG